MKTDSNKVLLTGNEAAASIAYRTSEMCVLYPITPSSEMSESVSEWSAREIKNIFGQVPVTCEMQSEAGVAGTLHGALQTGSLATTFTSSQGLLLMLPNLYKIAGELTPCVIHVATRAVATHALSVFGDHSDVMAVRQSGFGMLCATSVQEAHDMALIALAASLRSRIPFIHFFDGFRTSHEISPVRIIEDITIRKMISKEHLNAHRKNGLSPDRPVIRGTAQGPDAFFQGREASNPYFEACPEIVSSVMQEFSDLIGRIYQPFEYVGHPQATEVIVVMGSAQHSVRRATEELMARGHTCGMINVRLYRPFDAGMLVRSIPSSCRQITVLDRTKEPGAPGEPLYLDVLQAVNATAASHTMKVTGGRYGLSSAEFTPSMALTLFNKMTAGELSHDFTIGISDDVTFKSILPEETFLKPAAREIIILEKEAGNSAPAFSRLLNKLAETDHVQGYSERTYRKSNATGISHLRHAGQAFEAPYLIKEADLVICEEHALSDLKSAEIRENGTLIIVSHRSATAGESASDIAAERNIRVYHYPAMTGESVFQAAEALVMLHEQEIGEVLEEITVVSGNKEYSGSPDLVELLLSRRGSEAPVSLFPADGTFVSGTSERNPSVNKGSVPQWNKENCSQCGLCSVSCPQSALRIKAFEPADYIMEDTPSTVFPGYRFTLGINQEQCNECGLCLEACPDDALHMTEKSINNREWEEFLRIPETDRNMINTSKLSQQQFQEPLFQYSPGVTGCGEALYLKMLSQLFGDRLLIANATGSSSIFSGALPTTPWKSNADGRGPAWSNSLFEDTAEFGLGFRLSLDQQAKRARSLVFEFGNDIGWELASTLLTNPQQTEAAIASQRDLVDELKQRLPDTPWGKALLQLADALVKKSVWVIGGDGWAYDIGFGGLDHVMASGRNVNILVLDNEIYANTGGQMSKATPFGAAARLAPQGRKQQKKDLGRMMIRYENVYVAHVAIGADPVHTLRTLNEAEAFDGPSLIIAYCHSPEHGIDTSRALHQHKLAVECGQWILYRYDGTKINIDSPAPTRSVYDYYKEEERFAHVSPEEIGRQQEFIDRRWKTFTSHA